MFGFVEPLRSELRVKDLARYNAYYCGLCRSIRKTYGVFARLTLNYDCTFAALVVGGLYEDSAAVFKPKHCPYKPFSRKKAVLVESPALDFAASLNVLLAYHKLNDDWRDERKLAARLGMLFLRRAFRKAKKRHGDLSDAIEGGLIKLSALEKERCAEPDVVTDAFAGLLRDVMKLSPLSEAVSVRNVDALAYLGYNIGRLIYIADAWSDRERDAKKGCYNVFLVSADEYDAESVGRLLDIAVGSARQGYDLLDIKVNDRILSNVLDFGCPEAVAAVIRGDKIKKRRKSNESI